MMQPIFGTKPNVMTSGKKKFTAISKLPLAQSHII